MAATQFTWPSAERGWQSSHRKSPFDGGDSTNPRREQSAEGAATLDQSSLASSLFGAPFFSELLAICDRKPRRSHSLPPSSAGFDSNCRQAVMLWAPRADSRGRQRGWVLSPLLDSNPPSAPPRKRRADASEQTGQTSADDGAGNGRYLSSQPHRVVALLT
jgi:hypothetical protein